MAEPTPAQIRVEIVRCAAPGGFRYWVEKYALIEDQARGAIPFELWGCHQEAMAALERHDLIVVLKARQIGMSWLFGALYPLWLSHFHPNTLCMLFSQREEEAGELIRKCRFVWSRLPEWMRVPLDKDNAMELAFEGLESRILAFPSKPDAGSGYTARYVLSDEHAKQPYATEQYNAIRPTIDMGGQYVSVSSARGAATFHNELFQLARQGRNGFKPLFFPYSSHPKRDADWWEAKRPTYPKEFQFFQEYPRDADEAIQSSEPRRFPEPILKLSADKLDWHTPADLLTSENEDLAKLATLKPRWEELGLRVYQMPVAGRGYVCGADVAEGISGGDYSAALVLDRDTGEEVAVLHGRWDTRDYAAYLDRLCNAFGATLAIERNNHGLAAIQAVQRLHTERLKGGKRARYALYYEQPIISKPGEKVRPGRPGWLTTLKTKPAMLDQLADALREGECRPASEAVLGDLRAVVEDPETQQLGAKPPQHDDLAMAMAIAWQCLVRSAAARPRPQIPFAMGQHPDALLARMEGQSRTMFRRRRPPTRPAKRVPILKRLDRSAA